MSHHVDRFFAAVDDFALVRADFDEATAGRDHLDQRIRIP